MTKALKHVRVLDFSMGVAGPHAGMLCAQHGAQVTKIEPLKGDWGRLLGRQHGDLSAFSAIYNRGKKSLAVDLKDADAQRMLLEMAGKADVIIEAFRPGVMKRFGLDYDAVRAVNTAVIYVSVTGFGQTGPMSGMPATDVVLQAFSGFMNLNKDREGQPQRLDMILIDVIAGLYGFQAISAALLERAQGDKVGKHVDCSLLKCAIAFQAPKLVENVVEGGTQAMYVPLGTLPTRDGHVAVSVMHDHHFVALCNALGRTDLATSELYDTRARRIEREPEVMNLLRAEFGRRSTDEVVELLTRADVLHARVQSYQDLLTHEQTRVADVVTWTRQDGVGIELPIPNIPGAPETSHDRDCQSPHIGEHSVALMKAWGVPCATADGLVARGVVGVHAPS